MMTPTNTAATKAGDLLPCPFCGSKTLYVKHEPGTSLPPAYYVHCDDCGAQSGAWERGEHIEEWNRRATPPAEPALAADGAVVLSDAERAELCDFCIWLGDHQENPGTRRRLGRIAQIFNATAAPDSAQSADTRTEKQRFIQRMNYSLWMENQREGCEPSADWQEGYREGKKFAEALQELREASEQSADTPSEALSLTADEREWLEYAADHVADDSEPEDKACERVIRSLLARTMDEAEGLSIEQDADVEVVAHLCGWDNRKYMTPPDYSIWCERMRKFVQLAKPASVADKQPARGEVSDATKVIALALAHIANGIPNAKEVAADALSQAAALEAAARVRADHFVDANKKVGDTK